MRTSPKNIELSCPAPQVQSDKILLSHGGGGKMSQQLVQQVFFSRFNNEHVSLAHDGAMLPFGNARLAFSTDSYVVKPVFFPGGNIGELAVNGTVNDLVCCGAKPLFLSVGFILEEGFDIEKLKLIAGAMQTAAEKAGVQIVTGDTKVVEKGKGDEIFINTAGIGIIHENLNISPINCKPGNKIIINGTVADHGIAIMSAREGLQFETEIVSDTASLAGLMEEVYKISTKINVLRDPTRGGLASSLNEIAQASDCGITLFESEIPIKPDVAAACELLGFDPLYVANEGKILLFVENEDAGKILEIMKTHPNGRNAAIIGEVTSENKKSVRLKTNLGSHRIVDMISGEQLPRIC